MADIKKIKIGSTEYNIKDVTSGYITSSALSGYATESFVTSQGYITGITSTMVTNALGFTPYDSSNPDGYITGITSSDVTTALGYTPYSSANPNGYTSNVGTVTSVNNVNPVDGNVTLSIPSEVTETTVSGWGFTKNTGTVTSVNNVSPVNGNVTLSIPDTANLANKDLSNLTTTGNAKFQAPLVSGTNIKTINSTSILGSGNISVATASQGALADTALQPNDNISELTNDAGYITGITSSDVTTALGYTPYNSTNPNNYTSVVESTVSGWGFTKNAGTVTSVNNVSPVDGNVSLTIPTVNDATLTIQKNSSNIATFTANASSDVTVNITVPTDTNDLTNGAGYITGSALTNYVTTNTNQKMTAAKAVFGTDVAFGSDQTQKNLFAVVSDNNSQNGVWRGRLTVGAKDRTFILGTYGNKCVLGAHSWTNAQQGTGAAWEDVYINADGDKAVYIGGSPINGRQALFKVTNVNYTTAGKVQVNRVTDLLQSNWKDVACWDDNISKFTNDSGYITSSDVGDATLTIQKNGTNVQTFSANASSDVTANIIVPTSISDLTDDTSTTPIDKAESVVDNNTGYLKFWSGTKAQYDAITTKDSNTIYNVEDTNSPIISILDSLYPVGAIYIGTMSACPLATLGIGTWQLVAQDRVLQGAGTRGSVGTTVNESLPNHTHSVSGDDLRLKSSTNGDNTVLGTGGSLGGWGIATTTNNAGSAKLYVAGNTSETTNTTYQNNAPVQQDAYLVNIWERTA